MSEVEETFSGLKLGTRRLILGSGLHKLENLASVGPLVHRPPDKKCSLHDGVPTALAVLW